MAYTKTIVCLANSRRPGGFCIAGKEVHGDGFGEWIRPVNAQNDDAISPADQKLGDGNLLQLLDVISIPFLEHKPVGHQPENHLIDSNQSWEKKCVLRKQNLPKLLDHDVHNIWWIGKSAKKDRVPASRIGEVNGSLLLIRPESLTITAYSQWNVRAIFRYKQEDYNLKVTDPKAEARYAPAKNVGVAQYQLTTDSVYLCLSITAKPFESGQGLSYYKLVAAIIGDTD